MDEKPGAEQSEKQDPNTLTSKICTSCGRKFSSQFALCPDDGSELIPSAAQLLLGSLFDNRYRIETLLGSGAMGAVYKAHHEDLNRSVALKILHSDLQNDEDKLLRFHREGQALCLLSHQNIVPAYGFGVSEDAQAYMVLQYVEGRGLDKLLEEEGPLQPTRALSIFMQLCDGLNEAHKAGIVHRDLKPSNILVVNENGIGDQIKIFDFGLARFIPGAQEAKQKLTQTGHVFGSPLYMSPEQWRGQKADVRSDVYSLGCVMFECLTASPPLSLDDLLKVICDEEKIEIKNPSHLKPDSQISTALESIILKAITIDAESRYQSITDLKLALEQTPEYHWLVGQANTHRHGSLLLDKNPGDDEARKINRALIVCSGAVALLAVLVLLLFANDNSAILALEAMILPADDPRRINTLQKLGNVYLLEQRYADAANTLKKLQSLLEEKTRDGSRSLNSSSLAIVHEDLANTYLKIGSKTLGSSYARKAADLFNTLAHEAAKEGHHAESVDFAQRSIQMKLLLGPRNNNDLDMAGSYIFLAQCYQKQQDNEHALSNLEQALKHIERKQSIDQNNIAARQLEQQIYDELDSLAQTYFKSKQFGKSTAIFTRLLAAKEKINPETSSAVITAICSLGWSLSNDGNSRSAEPLFKRALLLMDRASTTESSEIVTRGNRAAVLESLGFCELELKKYRDAVTCFDRLIKICDQEKGDEVMAQRRTRAVSARAEALSRL